MNFLSQFKSPVLLTLLAVKLALVWTSNFHSIASFCKIVKIPVHFKPFNSML